MAVALPPISSGNSGTTKTPTYAKAHRSGEECVQRKCSRNCSRKEKELLEKRANLRALQKDLTKTETSMFRLSYKHNLCLNILSDGFHLTFKEIFNLIQQQHHEREATGPESLMWMQMMLEDEKDKLDTLKHYLTHAEEAGRRGDYQAVYIARNQLALYFRQTGDKWLVDHFFLTCLETAECIDTDGGRMLADGHCNVGIALEDNGWDRQLEGEAAYRLGLSYEACDSMESALVHLNNFYDICKFTKNMESMGRACDAIARSYAIVCVTKLASGGIIDEGVERFRLNFLDSARLGCQDKSIEYLKEFVHTAETTGNDSDLSRACHNLGNIYNSLGSYKEAVQYFSQAYNISRAISDGTGIQLNRVQSGIAQAHAMLATYSSLVMGADSSRHCLQHTVNWKSIRANPNDAQLTQSTPSADTTQTSN